MSPQDFLREIGPGLTLYSILVTLGIVAFRLGAALRSNERWIQKEFLDRLKVLSETFREAHIEPLIGDHIAEAAKKGIEKAFEVVMRLKIDSSTKQPFADPAQFADAVSDDRLKKEMAQMRSEVSPELLMAASQAEELLDDLDKKYTGRYRMNRLYEQVKFHNRLGYLLLWSLGVVLFAGILKLVFRDLPGYLVVSYLNVVALLTIFSCAAALRYYILERSFERLWEDIILYPRSQK